MKEVNEMDRIARVDCNECLHNKICSLKEKVNNLGIGIDKVEYPIKVKIDCEECIPKYRYPMAKSAEK